MRKVAHFLAFTTGFTGLVYQVIWQKYLATVLGSHSSATSLVLACFFLYMSAGYFAFGRFQRYLHSHKIWLFGIIEGGIGFYALISPTWFSFLMQNYSFSSNLTFSNFALSLWATTLFIGVPTFLMGGTIPVLTQALVKSFPSSHRVHGKVYAVNTYGAFIGVLIAGYYLIENWGLSYTLKVCGLVNLFVLAVTYIIYRWDPNAYSGLRPLEESIYDKRQNSKSIWLYYIIAFVAGYYVFSFETLLIRMVGISLGATIYSYSLVVATFIGGIAFGGHWVARQKTIKSLKVYYKIQLLLVVTCLGLYKLITKWPDITFELREWVRFNFPNFYLLQMVFFVFFMTVLFLPIALMGANLPLLFSFLKRRRLDLSQVVGRIYGVNALGSFLGAVVSGYLLYYYLHSDEVFKVTILFVILNLFLIGFTFFENRYAKLFNAVITALFVLFCFNLRSWDVKDFFPGRFLSQKPDKLGEVIHNQEDPSAWVVVTKQRENKTLFISGKPESATHIDSQIRGANVLIPLSVAPKIEKVFVVGLGAGLSTGIAVQFSEVKELDVAEISPAVISSAKVFSDYNYGFAGESKKLSIFPIDAFRHLKVNSKQFDVVISEPTSLWIGGTELLFTPEFLELVKSKLSREGVFAQWVPTLNSEPKMLFTILDNFSRTFEWVSLWQTSSYSYLVLASQSKPILSLSARITHRFNEQQMIYSDFQFSQASDLLSRQILSEFEVAGLAQLSRIPHSVDRPSLAFRSNRAKFKGRHTNAMELVKSIYHKPLPESEHTKKLLNYLKNPDLKSTREN